MVVSVKNKEMKEEMVKSLKEGHIVAFIDSEGNKGYVTSSEAYPGKYIAQRFSDGMLYQEPFSFEFVLDFGAMTDIHPIKIYVFDTLIERIDWLKNK